MSRKYLFLSMFLYLSLMMGDAQGIAEKHIVVLMVVHNAKSYVQKAIDSVLNQVYDNCVLMVIDDGSDDDTLEYVKKYVVSRKSNKRLVVHRNKTRRHMLMNYLRGSKISEDDDIIVALRAEDFLAHDRVLSCLNDLYQSKDIWMTYGPMRTYPSYTLIYDAKIPEEVIELNAYRDYLYVPTYLQSFYAGLFKKIPLGRFTLSLGELTADREYVRMNDDLPITLAMLELAGKRAYRVPDVLTLTDSRLHYHRCVVSQEEHDEAEVRTRGIPRCVMIDTLEP